MKKGMKQTKAPSKAAQADPSLKTDWDLSMMYASPADPQIEADLKAAEDACDTFAKKYRPELGGSDAYLREETALAEALSFSEKLADTQSGAKPSFYFSLRQAIDSSDSTNEAALAKISDRLTKSFNKILFFDLALGKIPKETQQRFLESQALKPWKYYLDRTWKTSRYDLTEAEEKILSLKSQTSRGMWVDGVEKLIGKQTLSFGSGKAKRQIPLSEAINLITSLPKKERHALSDAVMQRLREISDFPESELNAIITDKKINDELRGLKKPYSGTVLRYQNEEKTVENLVETVTRHFAVSHRFYKLKAKLLGEKSLSYADRSAPISELARKVSFAEQVETVREVFSGLGQKYRDIFDGYLAKGQIDVYPKKGKRGGGFCASARNVPTYILLNDTGNTDSIFTLAHEMGHGVHAEFSRHLSPFYEDCSMAVAEVASTLFELFLFDHQIGKMTEKERIIALHKRINGDIASIFRQVACFNFENELHMHIREHGYMPKEEMAKLMNKHMAAYLGPVFKLSENDGYFFADWTHLRSFFYVYSYAFGLLVSRALHRAYKKDKAFLAKIERFLSAGGSDTPENIFKSIGIDVTEPSFFEEGIKSIEDDIRELESLIAKQAKTGPKKSTKKK